MSNENYYENLDLRYIEIAEAAETFYTYESSALFYIPVLMPMIDSTNKITEKPLPSNRNILNKNRPKISAKAYSTGSISIPLHEERLGSWYKNRVPKGTKFMVAFIGGDINKCRIIGRY